MSRFIKLRKGFNINLSGKAQKKISDTQQPETFALKPPDFLGISRPKLAVAEGDNVKAGTPILFDKAKEEVKYVAPVSGEIAEIVRGEKRKLLEIRILADKEIVYKQFEKFSPSQIESMGREEAVKQMTKGGVWPNLIQRPYGTVADPDDRPKSIFISAFDSHPLAPEYDVLFKNEDEFFQTGLDILKKFTSGHMHLNINSTAEVAQIFAHAKNVELNKFAGPHPAGNVGVQIHHLDPINKGDIVWTINPYGVIQIGKLFLNGLYDGSKIIALTGSEVKDPQYYKTYLGASIGKMTKDNIKSDHVRYISGNVLTGEKIDKDGYVCFYHNQVTVVPEGDYSELFGWITPTMEKLSFHKAIGLLSFLAPNKEYTLDTNTRGEPRPFVLTGVFERVLPMDIYPTYLIKSIMAEDYDEMEALGIYEVVEEDLALCEFVDVSKHDIQSILRSGLTLIRNS